MASKLDRVKSKCNFVTERAVMTKVGQTNSCFFHVFFLLYYLISDKHSPNNLKGRDNSMMKK